MPSAFGARERLEVRARTISEIIYGIILYIEPESCRLSRKSKPEYTLARARNRPNRSAGLDDAEKFDVFSDARAQSLIVMLYRVERDLCPCSAESGSHAVTFIPEC